jgi:REP element-mobilizing transposase RayT
LVVVIFFVPSSSRLQLYFITEKGEILYTALYISHRNRRLQPFIYAPFGVFVEVQRKKLYNLVMENESKKSRKKNRLKDFDYSSNASYFLTICSDRRKEIFSKIVYDETATVIKQFKGAVSKEVGTTVWQKGFYDHIIRDDEDYNTKAQYIDTNPLTWERDELYTER